MDTLELKQKPSHKKFFLHWIKITCISILVLCFVTFNEEMGILTSFHNAPKSGNLINTFAFFGLCWFLDRIERYASKSRYSVPQILVQIILACFFSVFSLLSIYFENNASEKASALFSSGFSLLSIGLSFFGGVILFYIIIHFIWGFSIKAAKSDSLESGYLASFFSKHLYRNCIPILVICWLPQYLARFPGIIPYDGWQSLAMYFGATEMTTQHPLIWGNLIGILSELGLKIGLNWLAPLVICFVQHVLGILLVCYTISTLKKVGLPPKFLLGVFIFYIILPPFSLYASTVYNDYIYSLAIQLLTVELMYYLFKRKAFFSSRSHIIMTALAVFGTIVRYNGIYTMLVVIGFVGLREIILLARSKAKIAQSILIILFMVIPILGGQVLQNADRKSVV